MAFLRDHPGKLHSAQPYCLPWTPFRALRPGRQARARLNGRSPRLGTTAPATHLAGTSPDDTEPDAPGRKAYAGPRGE